MKSVSTALRNLIEGARFVQGQGFPSGFAAFDLYTITLTSGLRLTYTTADFPITAPSTAIFTAPVVYGGGGDVWTAGITWTPAPIDFADSKALGHWKTGLDSDTWTVKFSPRTADMGFTVQDLIAGQPWLFAAASGQLASADCIVSRAYFASPPSWPLPPGGAVPVGTTIKFRGFLGEIDLTSSSATLVISDYRQYLQAQMPRNYFLPSCRFRFGGTRCGVNLATYTNTGAVASGSRSAITSSSPLTVPGGSGTYELGVLTMTSGRNSGVARQIRTWDLASFIVLLSPLPYHVSAGDTFTVSAGCHKTTSDCVLFSNLANFGGDPYIPVQEISL